MSDNILMIIGGVAGIGGLVYSWFAEKRYKKAKNYLQQVKATDIDSVKEATNSAKKAGSYEGFVTGQIRSLDHNKVVLKESRPNDLSIFSLSTQDNIWKGYAEGSKFELVDNNEKIVATPTFRTKSFGLQNNFNGNSPLIIALQGLVSAVFTFGTSSINLGTSEYIAFDGQNVTLFGKISYNVSKGIAEISKIKFLFSGAKKDVELHLSSIANSEWWKATVVEILTVGVLGLVGYYGSQRLKSWYIKRRNQRFREQLEQKLAKYGVADEIAGDFVCKLCYQNVKCVVYRPCNHLAACANCDANLNRNQCPMCRAQILSRTIIALE